MNASQPEDPFRLHKRGLPVVGAFGRGGPSRDGHIWTKPNNENVSLVVPQEIRVSGHPVRPRYIMYLPATSVGYVSRAVKHMESIRNP